jgi:hypothetical protein
MANVAVSSFLSRHELYHIFGRNDKEYAYSLEFGFWVHMKKSEQKYSRRADSQIFRGLKSEKLSMNIVKMNKGKLLGKDRLCNVSES